MHRIFVIISLIILGNYNCYASVDFNKNCKSAFEQSLSFDFKSANLLLQKEKKSNPNNLIIDYIHTYQKFLSAAISEDNSQLKDFEAFSDLTLHKFEKENFNTNPYINYCICDIYMLKSFMLFKNESYFTGANNIRKALNAFEKNNKKFPTFIPNKKAQSLFNIAFGSIPEQYAWIFTAFNIDASINQGIKQIQSLVNTSITNPDYYFLRQESILIYIFVSNNFNNNSSKLSEIEQILKTDSLQNYINNSQLLSYSKMSLLSNLKKNDEVIQCYYKINKSNKDIFLYYLDFKIGESLLFKLDLTSKYYFEKYLGYTSVNSYKKSCVQKLAWLDLLNGKENSYKSKMQSILAMPKTIVDADKQAQNEAIKKLVPNVNLLKSRILFDGGYYKQAKEILTNKEAIAQYNSQNEALEYYYRLGRIYHEIGQSSNAHKYYMITIEKGKNQTSYFAANAALQSGLLYEKANNFAKAKEMFKLCLTMECDEYQNSINQKAKAGLNRLEKK